MTPHVTQSNATTARTATRAPTRDTPWRREAQAMLSVTRSGTDKQFHMELARALSHHLDRERAKSYPREFGAGLPQIAYALEHDLAFRDEARFAYRRMKVRRGETTGIIEVHDHRGLMERFDPDAYRALLADADFGFSALEPAIVNGARRVERRMRQHFAELKRDRAKQRDLGVYVVV
jgi:hypothetical protein